MIKKISIFIAVITVLLLLGLLTLHIVNINSEFQNYKFKKMELPDKLTKSIEECDPARPGVPLYCEINYELTEKYNLYLLFWFQTLSPENRIKNFKKSYDMDSEPDKYFNLQGKLDNFIDIGKQYEIAKDFCIGKTGDVLIFKQVKCINPIPIEKLPYKRCNAFERFDKDGSYYAEYDLSKLKKEFKSKPLVDVEKELEDSLKKIEEQDKKNASKRMQKYSAYSNNIDEQRLLMCALEGVCDF